MDFYTLAIIQGLGYAAMALGIFISLRIFNIPDITTDGSYTLGGVITAVCLIQGYHPISALLFSMIAGAIAGIFTGLIHTRLGINALLSGILVMTALFSINLMIMGRSNIPLIDTNNITAGRPLLVFFVIAAILIIIVTWLLKTDFGIAMRAMANSEQMVRSMGVNTSAMKITGLAIANALTALSGNMMVQFQGFCDINMGIGIVISGLAAVMIGESLYSFSHKQKILLQVLMVVAGSIIFRLILALVLSMGLDPNYLKLLTALTVLIVVGLTYRRRKMI
jgi:putative tryptophan/tyrosine transport system permease protein